MILGINGLILCTKLQNNRAVVGGSSQQDAVIISWDTGKVAFRVLGYDKISPINRGSGYNDSTVKLNIEPCVVGLLSSLYWSVAGSVGIYLIMII